MTIFEPFEVRIADEALIDLRGRLRATRWAPDVFEADWRFGAPRPFVQALCEYWRDNFDWRALEARINRQPQFTTAIDGITVHTVHRRSSRSDALPLILLHGWPGSFLDFLDLYDPLAEPESRERAFHVVTPSLPGYGFSTVKPQTTPQRIASMMVELMQRLGYDRFLVQGGNWGSLIGTEMARQHPERVIGLHLSSISGSPPPDKNPYALSEEEQSWIADHSAFPHFVVLSQTPASISYALNDSPAGLAAWIGERLHDWADNRAGPAISPDRMIATVALYWFTGSIGSSSKLYYEMAHDMPAERFVTVPTAVAIFPKSVVKLPRAWAARHYTIVQWTTFDRGGHFPAIEVPELLIGDLRRFARELGRQIDPVTTKDSRNTKAHEA